MEYFSILVVAVSVVMFVFLFSVKLRVGEFPKYSEDEAEGRIASMERWIDQYKSMPDEKKNELMNSKYRNKYVSLKELQLEMQRYTAIRKDLGIDDKTRTALEEYFPIAEREIDLVKSGVDPEEAREIAYKGTKYECVVK